jgi:lipopolysaccharide/colanic/teichoic acid biosynthesis glycosyltransferase
MSPPTTTAVEAAPSRDFTAGSLPQLAAQDLQAPASSARSVRATLDVVAKRALDVCVSALLLLLCLPLFAVIALLVKLDSPGPLFYRCRRVGRGGSELSVLKFRKMRDGARGPALTVGEDERFTRVGRFLAATKLDELPQLINVLLGDMSLVGPRPEDAEFVGLMRADYEEILAVRPGITGLTQLAFANESDILDPDDALRHYVDRLLPQKTQIDRIYAARRTIGMDLRILLWTVVAILGRRDVAVNRICGTITLRRRQELTAAVPSAAVSSSEEARQ